MKLRLPRAALTAAIFVALAASPVSAQRQAVHKGFWISFGFGAGNAFGDDAFDGDSRFGGATFLRMGGPRASSGSSAASSSAGGTSWTTFRSAAGR